jgi:hypothetical protein
MALLVVSGTSKSPARRSGFNSPSDLLCTRSNPSRLLLHDTKLEESLKPSENEGDDSLSRVADGEITCHHLAVFRNPSQV